MPPLDEGLKAFLSDALDRRMTSAGDPRSSLAGVLVVAGHGRGVLGDRRPGGALAVVVAAADRCLARW